MKNLIFTGYPDTERNNIVIFSPLYQRMVKEIKSKLEKKNSIDLFLGRISDEGVSIGSCIHFFDVVIDGHDILTANYYNGYYSEDGNEKLPIKKTIRFDNLFGEIPILPGYEKMPKFFTFGENIEAYESFIEDARTMLINEIGNNVQLRYKNDDGTFSVINGTVKEVNKSNIFMDDFSEILVMENKTKSADLLVSRNKNHRFVSQNGYLCWICPTQFTRDRMSDDGEVFCKEETWDFILKQKVA